MRRPKHLECPVPEVSGDVQQGREGLPVVCLVGTAAPQLRSDPAVLARGITRFLREATPHRAPYAAYSFPPDPADGERNSAEGVRTALVRLAQGFAAGLHGSVQVRFRRFALVNWLMQQGPSAPDAIGQAEPQHDRTLHARLLEREMRRRRFLGRLRHPEAELGELPMPWWVRVPLWLVPWVMSWIRLRTGAEYRWLLRQPYLAPGDPGTFIGFAERLTYPNREDENQGDLTKLMVNAFLEDLRVPYAHRRRLRSVRRTAYCVAVLDGTHARNAGHLLITAIIDVRNETGAFDPLLTIVCSDDPPPEVTAAGEGVPWTLRPNLFDVWKDQFLSTARERVRSAWYLPVGLPPLLTADDPQYDRVRKAQLSPDRLLRLKPVPWWATRKLVWSVVALLIAAGVATPLFMLNGFRDAHCGLSWNDPDAATLRTASTGECVGVAPHGFGFHSADASFTGTLRTIADLNRRADRLHHDHPHRPLVSLVNLSSLYGKGDTQQLAYVSEQLQGAAVAQKLQLDRDGDTEPLIRILPASAGYQMRFHSATTDILRRMMRSDPTIMGVLGLDQSRQETIEAMHELTALGLPMVGTTLSADSLVSESPLYFQVSPQNQDEAQVALAYAEHARQQDPSLPKRVTIVQDSDPGNTYSRNLHEDAVELFGRNGYRVDRTGDTYASGAGQGGRMSARLPTPEDVGQRLCGYRGVVFFAGVSTDFERMLRSMGDTCRTGPALLLGDDDTAILVADKKRMQQYLGTSFAFLDFTVGTNSCSSTSRLYGAMKDLFPRSCADGARPGIDRHGALNYDAVNLYVNAIRQITRPANWELPLTPATIRFALTEVQGDHALQGESGTIDFGGQVGRRVPVDKLISVLRFGADARVTPVGLCGRLSQALQDSLERHPDAWCSHDHGDAGTGADAPVSEAARGTG